MSGSNTKRNHTKKYDGNWSEMDEDFRVELFNLIEHLLKPERLVIKKINENNLKGSEYLEFVLQYFKLFQSDKLPQAKSIYESTVEKQMTILVEHCVEIYKSTVSMNQDVVRNERHISLFHDVSNNKALQLYRDSKKMGNVDHVEKFKLLLEVKISEAFKEWKEELDRRFQLIEAEKERIRLENDEQHQLLLKKIENEKKEIEEKMRQERIEAEKQLQLEKADRIRALQEERLKIEEQNRQQEEQFSMLPLKWILV